MTFSQLRSTIEQKYLELKREFQSLKEEERGCQCLLAFVGMKTRILNLNLLFARMRLRSQSVLFLFQPVSFEATMNNLEYTAYAPADISIMYVSTFLCAFRPDFLCLFWLTFVDALRFIFACFCFSPFTK